MRKSLRMMASLSALAIASLTVPAVADSTATPLGDLTVLATTDVHGHAVDYDYFTGEAFGAQKPEKALGMDHLATAIKKIRTEKGDGTVVLMDNGDLIQGSPINTYYQNNRKPDSVDPMAKVLNYLKYDVGVVGNHEFNYGMDNLRQLRGNLKMPLLGANVIDVSTNKPYLEPYTMLTRQIGGEDVKIGVIGVVTPGVRVWDKANVEGVLRFQDCVEAVKQWVPEVRKAGADVVVVLAHTGLDAEGYTWNPADLTENIATSIATQTSGVDLIIGGHSHVMNKADVVFTNAEGKPVLFTQPYYWARSLSQVTLPIVKNADGKKSVNWEGATKPTAVAVQAKDYPADDGVLKEIQPWHDETVAWVKTVIAQSKEEMPAATSPWEDTPIVDFINMVQTDELKKAMKGTKYENLPVISQASPFSRSAIFHKGDVTIADMAGLYIYDNTLYGIELTGAQLRDYLEFSARYYKQQEPNAVVTNWEDVTNAQYDGMTRGIPDYSYDEMSGINYHINISKPVGERIDMLTMPDGTPITDDMHFILAVNNYRWSGGSGYPHVTTAPVVYNDQKEIRELMIDWAQANKVIDPATFFVKNWEVSTSAYVAPQPAPQPTPEPAPQPAPQPTPAKPAPGAHAGHTGTLSNTGADVMPIAILALAMLLAGSGALVASRRQQW
ncbi:bifunctional metallophosphatase/5'-nucleotidase [Trueperella sp. LYQ143]|uniref:bifunctional metallophosphatase/5'-nucleotidase n=1 Tax=unclassified Trueperella TaxID=2630174 RepID=UPI0039835552